MKVCVIGSGLTALALAKALVNENIPVDISISKTIKKISKNRTLGISKSNFDYFNKKIINIKKIIWKLNKIEIFSENLKNEKILDFENSNDQLFSIIKNFKLHNLLFKSLLNDKLHKKINFENKLKNFDKYDLIINTDSSNFISKKYFFKKVSKSYNSNAYVTTINHEKISNNVATQIFTKYGPLAFLPISKYETSLVYSINDLKKINKKNVEDLICKYNFKYKIKKIEDIESFELKSFILRSYYYKNVLAFGDLLHRIHPLAGQGFNMTIRDIKYLIEIIKERKDLGLPIDSIISDKFEKKIRHKNYIFSNGIDLIYEFFNFERKINSKFLSKSVKALGKNPFMNKIFTKIADKGFLY